MFKSKKSFKTLACLALSVLSIACFSAVGLMANPVAKADTVPYQVGSAGAYVTENFDNAISYKTKTDATVISDNANTYGKTLHKMLSVKLSEEIDISAANRVWDGFLINLSFSSSFKFYMWLGDSATDGSVVISRNYNSSTDRYEKFLDANGNDLSANQQGVRTKSGYYTSTEAISGTWVYKFADIVVKPNQIIDELLFGLRVNERTFFGQGYEINSISVYKEGATASDYQVKTLFHAKDITVTTDANNTTAGLNLANPQNGTVVNTARSLANNTGAFIDATTYANENQIGNNNVSVSVPMRNVTVNYVDEEGNTLKDSETTAYRKGQAYTVEAPTIASYEFKQSDVALTGTVNSDITINLVYAIAGVKVTVNYLDAQGTPIAEQTSRSYYSGANYTVTPLSLLGYEFVSADVALQGVINSDITINITYRAVSVFVITVKCVNEQGEPLISPATQEYNDGATYEIEPAEIEHYSFKDSDIALTGTVTGAMEITLTYGIDQKNPPRTQTDVNYAVSDDGLRITDGLVGGVIFKTKDNFSTVADSNDTYGKTILATFKINFTETIDATEDWDGLLIRIKNNSSKNVKFNAYLLSNGVLGRNYVSSTGRDEVFVDTNGNNLGKAQLGIRYASAYPTISAYADGTWNYKFSDLTTGKSDMTAVEAFILGIRVTTTEFAGCDIVIGSIAAYKVDESSSTGYTVKTLFNSKDLVFTNDADYTKADVNLANPDNGKVITSAIAPINNTGLFVADQYYSNLHPTILSAIKLEIQGCTITYNYLDENGEQISVPTIQNVPIGGTYSLTAKEITGYTYKSSDKPLTGTVEDDMVINLSYELIKFTLTVKFVDQAGNKLKEDVVMTVNYGDYIVIDEKNDAFKVDGYKHLSVDGSAKFTVYADEVRTVVCEVAPVEKSGCAGQVTGAVYFVLPCLFIGAMLIVRKAKREN